MGGGRPHPTLYTPLLPIVSQLQHPTKRKEKRNAAKDIALVIKSCTLQIVLKLIFDWLRKDLTRCLWNVECQGSFVKSSLECHYVYNWGLILGWLYYCISDRDSRAHATMHGEPEQENEWREDNTLFLWGKWIIKLSNTLEQSLMWQKILSCEDNFPIKR